MHRSEPHAEAEILCVAETALDLPTPGIQVDQGPRGFVGGAGGQAPRLFHALRPHADHGGDRIRLGGDRSTAQGSRATAGANPIGRGRVSPSVAVTAVLPQRMTKSNFSSRQHPIELVVAEAAIGHDAHADIGGQRISARRTKTYDTRSRCDGFSASPCPRSAKPAAWPVRGRTTETA